MPEGPELRYSRDFLRQSLVGKVITGIQRCPTGRYSNKPPEGFDAVTLVLPLRVESIDTHGKFMWWTLEGSDGIRWYMHCTYGMSGGWFREASRHACFFVEVGEDKVFFNDPRHFGTIKFVSSAAAHAKKLRTLGPCIFDPGLTPEIFAKNALRKPSRTIAEALMDQSAVAGVGNYLRAEILYDCGIDPWKNVIEIASEQYVKLCEATMRIAKASYKSQGASIKTYRNVDGSIGTAQFDFKVYGRSTCPLDHDIMRRYDENKRMIHWCALCQK